MLRTLLLLLILLLAFLMAFIPHIGYAYPLHVDEWMHLTYAKTIAETGAISFPDPFTGEGTVGPGTNVWLGYHVLMAMVQRVSGIDWLVLWRFGPSVIFMLTVFCVYIFAKRQGYGLEAAFFTCLIPTTVGLLGPAFMVPMALGLLFIPLSLYIAFYVKSWPSYLLLFLIACFLWLMHPTMAAIQGIVLAPFILINLKNSPVRSLWLLASLLLPVLIALPLTINQLIPAAGQLLSAKDVFPPPYLDLPAVLQIYGFIPLIFCFIGTIYLLKRGGKSNYALLLALVLLLGVMLAFVRFEIGMDTLFVRGITTALLLIGIIAGAGLYWLRTQIVSARILDKYKPNFAVYSGSLLCALSVAVILTIAIPSRLSVPYYHMIDDEDYRAFVWIRDNIGPDYERALVDPWKATAFTAVTGKNITHRIQSRKEKLDDLIYNFLNSGCKETSFLIDNRTALVISNLDCANHDMIEICSSIFITNPNIENGFNRANLLKNASFELCWNNPPEFWKQWSQNCGAKFIFPEPDRTGYTSVAIQMNAFDLYNPSPQAGWVQNTPVRGGQSYVISGWIKTENIRGKDGAIIVIKWKDSGNQWLSDTKLMDYIKGSTDWIVYTATVIAPANASFCTVGCYMVNCSGTAWYDDILFKAK